MRERSQRVLPEGPPIEAGGPYDGRLNRAVALIPSGPRDLVAEVGGMAMLLGKVLRSAVRNPRGYWGDVVEQMHFTITKSWFAIAVGIFGFLTALATTGMQFVNLAGVGEYFGPLLVVHCTRTFTVWVSTLLVAGVIGASITAELGSRKVREELDAMVVMGVDPIRVLVLPKVVAVILITTLLSIPAQWIAILSCQFAASFIGGIESPDFYSFLWINQSQTELIAMVVNCLLAGTIIATVSSYKGLHAQGGSTGLGRAVNQSVVVCFLALFVLQLGYNAVVLGLFPELGGFR
ncbi:ABC transporter permease [Nocardioides sp. WS12]|uniref:MlaE family ABC transporter permease n=1 Tax=Nocardioides sp. WS12 TaxID=2486272 RepID=UPI0015F7F05E|nr:ABC transporter permease [Nocardioides sp. WS12]